MKKIQFIDGTMLKIMAMIFMVFDHIGDNLFHNYIWMRAIGRIALPLFAFCISEGFYYTKNKKKYLIRIFIFALISEIPFNLLVNGTIFYPGHQNVMFTFFLAILLLIAYEKIVSNKKIGSYILGGFVVLIFSVISLILKVDYNIFAVLLVFIYYAFKSKKDIVRNLIATIYQLVVRGVGIYACGALSFIPILLYNGKKGKGLKWLFYVFYPLHMLIIYFIKVYLNFN